MPRNRIFFEHANSGTVVLPTGNTQKLTNHRQSRSLSNQVRLWTGIEYSYHNHASTEICESFYSHDRCTASWSSSGNDGALEEDMDNMNSEPN